MSSPVVSPAQPATQATQPPQGGPSPAGGQGVSPQGPSQGPAIIRIVAGISQLANMLGQAFPAAAPMAQEIQKQVQMAQAKIAETQSAAQPQAPPI